MRELTQEEIDNAPEWSSRYYSDEVAGIGYLNTSKGEVLWANSNITRPFSPHAAIFKASKPIPRKQFNISEHKFTDNENLELESQTDKILTFYSCNGENFIAGSYFDFYKHDVISMAKHFRLTMEDLK